MKQIILILVAGLMMAPNAFGFDKQFQKDLDNIQNVEQLTDYLYDVDMEGVQKADLDQFFAARSFRCVAKNRRGARYKAKGKNLRRVKRRAMQKCRRDSFRPRSCKLIRCTRKGGIGWDIIDLIIENS